MERNLPSMDIHSTAHQVGEFLEPYGPHTFELESTSVDAINIAAIAERDRHRTPVFDGRGNAAARKPDNGYDTEQLDDLPAIYKPPPSKSNHKKGAVVAKRRVREKGSSMSVYRDEGYGYYGRQPGTVSPHFRTETIEIEIPVKCLSCKDNCKRNEEQKQNRTDWNFVAGLYSYWGKGESGNYSKRNSCGHEHGEPVEKNKFVKSGGLSSSV